MIQNIVQNTQARNFYNPEVDIKPLAQREKVFLKHGVERLGEIIAQGSSGPRVIVELSSPVHEMLMSFVDH
jgi:hypothetical protein